MKKITMFLSVAMMLMMISCSDSDNNNGDGSGGGSTTTPDNFSNIGDALRTLGTIKGYTFMSSNDSTAMFAYYYLTAIEYTETYMKDVSNDIGGDISHLSPLPVITADTPSSTYTFSDNGSIVFDVGEQVFSFSSVERKDISNKH